MQIDGMDLDFLQMWTAEKEGLVLNRMIKSDWTTIILNKGNERFSLGSITYTQKPQEPKKSIEDYILTIEEQVQNGFDLNPEFLEPGDQELDPKYQIVAIDCEMVNCGDTKKLARVTMIDKNFDLVLDELVKIPDPITDYLTKYSGLTEDILKSAQYELNEIRLKVLQFLNKKTIICGHSLENDLLYLGIRHNRVIDTSVLYPHSVQGYKLSLKYLTFAHLNKTIQQVEII